MHVVPGVARHGDSSPFDGMLVLAMAALRTEIAPSVPLDCFYQIADFHRFRPLRLIVSIPAQNDS